MYNNPKFPTIAEARAKQWECSKCQETFANYKSYEITRIILMVISHVILNVGPYNLDIHYCRIKCNESK